eukprot:6064706-Pleurochrysis_carterae.AAC.2
MSIQKGERSRRCPGLETLPSGTRSGGALRRTPRLESHPSPRDSRSLHSKTSRCCVGPSTGVEKDGHVDVEAHSAQSAMVCTRTRSIDKLNLANSGLRRVRGAKWHESCGHSHTTSSQLCAAARNLRGCVDGGIT